MTTPRALCIAARVGPLRTAKGCASLENYAVSSTIGTKPERRSTVERSVESDRQLRRKKLDARWSAIGIQIAVSVAIGCFGGVWLDNRLDTTPLFVLVGIVVGLGAVSWDIYKLLKLTQKMED